MRRGKITWPRCRPAAAVGAIRDTAGRASSAASGSKPGDSFVTGSLGTSACEEGQIYIPEMNYLLLIGCIALTGGFGSSSNIAAAHGIAVTGTMIITSLLFWVVARRLMGWSAWAATSLVALFLVIEFAFFGANVVKIAAGGWFVEIGAQIEL